MLVLGVLISMVVCVVVCGLPLRAKADPLGIQNQFLLNSVHLSAAPESATTLSEGAFTFESRFSITNSFVSEDFYVVDAEQRTTDLAFGYGLPSQTELGFVLPIVWRGGGVFDHTIRQWHETFNLPDGARETVQDDQYSVQGQTDSGTFSFDEKGFSLGDLRLALKHQFWGSPETLGWQGSVGAEAALPTAREGFGQNGVDGALKLLAAYRGSGWVLDGGAAVLLYSDQKIDGIEYDAAHFEGFLGAEIELCEWLEARVGVYGGQQSIQNLSEMPGEFLYLDTGLESRVGAGQSIVLLVRENPYPSRQSADVTITLAYRVAFNLQAALDSRTSFDTGVSGE